MNSKHFETYMYTVHVKLESVCLVRSGMLRLQCLGKIQM